ncbi:DegT/DnrJ/EryC1/StrS family aminotransferase [bacterium]|nr:DegT/DnrJ/EryC1/StrS family aminotransferase [bacterium]
MKVPFSRPAIGEEEIAEVVACLRSGWITSGPRTAQFEREFAARHGAAEALAVTSATAGLHLAMLALDLRPGDEVITTPLTWPATVNAIVLAGGTPVLVDVEAETLNIDPRLIAGAVTPRTRAVLPVHYAGQPCDLDAVAAAAPGARLIEDAAHAAGASYRDQPIGSRDTAIFSFHPIKNMTTGEGGMVTTNDPALARRLRLLRFHGVERDAWKAYGGAQLPLYDVVEPGLKYNLTDIQSAIGLHQLRKLDAFNAERARLAARYDAALRDVPALRPLGRAAHSCTHAHHLYVVLVDPARLAIDRNAFMAEVIAADVGLGLHFTAVHELTYYRRLLGDLRPVLPVATDASARLFSLPLFPGLSDAEHDRVVEVVADVARRHRR